MSKLDLGCGKKKKQGYTGIDVYPYEGVDVVLNLDDPNLKLPYNDNSIEKIYASHFLEHILHFYELLNECWRILRPNGEFEVFVPLAPYRSAFDDPEHVRFFTKSTFQYFTKNPPGNYSSTKLKGFWEITLNDWSPAYTEDTMTIIQHELRELHVIMKPDKSITENQVKGGVWVDSHSPARADN